ncbi:hypothetical protein PV08_05159 [Exophiala spinifera]|uniref:Uncharacterized protein n=1 Tax=Exophiala spinifera TaxID=91928 RepID=A0A0D2C2Y2_9EURO|nr:uncharacterized protein PV08_05159 [Exophiala spinifera]KIW17964.1 hypothetical protein PV08_05159 [Exophiala spinifera]
MQRPGFEQLPLRTGDPPFSAWSLYGPNDQLGTLNLLTPEVVTDAAQEIKSGVRIGLDSRIDYLARPPHNRKPLTHTVIHKAPRAVHDDELNFNSQISSQWDGLRHFGYQSLGLFYNGAKVSELSGPEATPNLGIHAWCAQGIVGRGVLLDYLHWSNSHGRAYDKLGDHRITVQTLQSIADAQGVSFRKGDILIIRTGFHAGYDSLSDEEKIGWAHQVPTKHVGVETSREMAKWLWDSQFSAVAADAPAFEAIPKRSSGINDLFLHEILLSGWGMPIDDPGYQMLRQAEQGDVDFITGDYLAEVSLAENAEAMRAGEHDGWFSTCWDGIEQSIDIIVEKRIKVVVNGGGLNPRGLAEKVQLLKEKNCRVKVAFVSGDDLFEETKNQIQSTGQLPPHHDSDNPNVIVDKRTFAVEDLDRKPLVAANAYLGARAIVAALNLGADIIICGRVSDASPVIAAAWWWYGWQATDYDRLAGALLAGHLIECSGYVTGGNFAGFDAFDLDLLVDIPFGIAEISDDGTCVITIHDTGKGIVNVDVVRCQLLYELQGAIYLNSDVTADVSNAEVQQVGKNRVRLTGVKGSPPPATTKLGIFYRDGYQCQLLLNATGYNTALKWELLQKQVKYVLEQKGLLHKFDVIDFQIVGTPETNPRTQLCSTTYCRIFAQANEAATVASLRGAWAEFVMQHFSGLHYALDFRSAAPMRYIAYYPALYPQDSLREFGHILNSDGSISQSISADHPPEYQSPGKRLNYDTEPSFVPLSTETKLVRLGVLALGRSGDKGGNINFGIFPKVSKIWPWFQGFMSRTRLRDLIGEDWRDEYFIERMEFPGIHSVHFVIYGILGRGSSSTVALDNLGKGFADYIRDKWVEVPVEIVHQISE